MDEVTRTLLELASSPWIYPALFVLVVADAFLVVLPSETVVVALGALAGAAGNPSVLILLPVAAAGAILGDTLCYLIGRRVGLDRWAWQRRGPVAAGLNRVRRTVLIRPAVLIFTARYIPYARIAVNLTAGAAGLASRRFLPLTALAGCAWAGYNLGVGSIFGRVMTQTPLLAIGVSVVVAIVLGVTVDLVIRRVAERRDRVSPAQDGEPV